MVHICLPIVIELLISLSFHRFEIEIEPIFASIALYDLKEKKKVRKAFAVVFTISDVFLVVFSVEWFNFHQSIDPPPLVSNRGRGGLEPIPD